MKLFFNILLSKNTNTKLNLGVCGDWFVGPGVEAGWISANDLYKKINK